MAVKHLNPQLICFLMSKKSSVRGSYSTRTTKLTTLRSKHSQSALEYMMTYGWAILIIVIVAAGLYSLGIFNPSSSAGTTITGFSGLGSVQAECIAGQGLEISVGNSAGYTIHISRINYTVDGTASYLNESVDVLPDSSNVFFVPSVCPSSSGSRYSGSLTLTYTEPGQVFGNTQFSSGTVSGTTSSSGHNVQINIISSAQTIAPFQQMLSFPGVNYANYSHITSNGINLANTFFTRPNGTVIPSWIETQNASVPTINGLTTEYINTTTSSVLKPANSFTVAYWIYLRSYPLTNTALTFVTNHGSGSGASGYTMNLYGTSLYLSFDTAPSARHSYAINAPADGLNINQWTFIAGAYTASTGVFSIYINGVGNNCTCTTAGTTLMYNSSSALAFGLAGNSAANASITDMQFYNTTLSPAQINSLYAGGMHASPIIKNKDSVGWWSLNGTLRDFSGNGNNGVGTGITMSNSTVWLKFNGGLPAGTTSVYMHFLQTQDQALNIQNIGEAPQLSGTYGEYDDGANVFNVYSDFAGTSLPSSFTSYNGSNAYFSVNNCLQLQVNNAGCTGTWAGVIYDNSMDSTNSIVETYGSGTRSNGPDDVGVYTANSASGGGYAGVANGWGWGHGSIGGGYVGLGNPFDISSGSGVASIYWIGQGDEGIGWNYNFVSSTDTSMTWNSNLFASIQTGQCSPGADMNYYWFRIRTYPPNGVMPSISFGNVQ